LGEVDLGFLVWYYLKKDSLNSLDSILKNILFSYQKFLIQILGVKKQVICMSVPLPTISNNQNFKINERRSIKTSLKKRITTTFNFNSQLCKFCKNNNIIFLNLDNEILNEKNRIKSEFLNLDMTDHHYNFDIYSELLIKELKNAMPSLF